MRAFASVGVASSSNYRLIDESSECNFFWTTDVNG
jgi:hypothetical protein